ncbi:MAG: hypothetical protein RJA57_599 [Bacteroidota bacterium]
MKVVVIGGGVAGIGMAILLRKYGYEVVLCEREDRVPARGNAFLMHSEGMSILKELTSDAGFSIPVPGRLIEKFSFRRPDDTEIKFQKIDPWQCMKRKQIIEYFYTFFPRHLIHYDRNFSHFEWQDGKVTAAVFRNGAIETGDLFIAADGGNSRIREQLFGKTDYSETIVKEVVGIVRDKAICENYAGQFTKFQHGAKGISMGFIPISNDELVWYTQFDSWVMDLPPEPEPEVIKRFCMELLEEFPPLVRSIVEKDDYQEAYIWHTRDFDMLPTYHRSNVVLIGDAAHLMLPFTSAGVTNALIDAQTLISCLLESADMETAFRTYYQLRAEDVARHLKLGRDLKRDFLMPVSVNDDDISVPLIRKQRRPVLSSQGRDVVDILYFTDPICSTCWTIQPQLRKLQLEYGAFVRIDYKMGGLLEKWENYDRDGIRTPEDVAKHWEEVCESYQMPINNGIWLEDPLPSSYPPSIAFKAAQLQNTGMAVMFLRRIMEMVFVENKNIINKEFLFRAAYDVGLDAARLLRDLDTKARTHFMEDLQIAEALHITLLPTLIFRNQQGETRKLEGYQDYETFVGVLRELTPGIRRSDYDMSPDFLFRAFQTFTTREFSFLRDEDTQESQKLLEALHGEQKIRKFISPAGNIWFNNNE